MIDAKEVKSLADKDHNARAASCASGKTSAFAMRLLVLLCGSVEEARLDSMDVDLL